MSTELRTVTMNLEFKSSTGLSGIQQITRALSDSDETIDELNRTMGEHITVTKETRQSEKQLTADARRLVTQMERNKRKVADLTRLYAHQSSVVNRTADEQEVLNAVYKLGANATAKQQQETAQMVNTYQRLRKETTKTQGSFRNLRGVSQNLGWQLQDVAVQAQMGTSAFVIFSQQGSQMASAFGPTGALIGAFIAVSGALLGVAASSDKAKEADKALKAAKLELIPLLQEQAKELKFLEEAQIRVLKLNDTKTLKDLQRQLRAANAAVVSSGNNWNLTGKKLKEHNEELDRNRSKQALLTEQIFEVEERMSNYNKNLDENNKKHVTSLKSISDLIKAYETQAGNIGLNARAIAVQNLMKSDATALDYERLAIAFDLIEADELKTEAEKKAAKEKLAAQKAADKLLSDAEKKEKSRHDVVIRLFESERNRTIKQTETVQQEYDRRKTIIDNYLAEDGSDKTKAAQQSVDLEKWKTLQLASEYNKREAARRQIEQGQVKQTGRDDPAATEQSLFINNVETLNGQLASLGVEQLDEKKRIHALIEQEVLRHTARLDEISQTQLISNLQNYATFTGALGQVFGQLSQIAEEGSKEAAALFYINQGIAIADAIVNTELAATKAGAQLGVFGIPAAAMIRATGYASVGVIAGQTIAGAYDKGGTIPGGQMGIVSEYGDELVNGQLIKGPAKVTSREDTAKLMNNSGGGNTKIIIENKIDGASYRTEQIDENTVRVIAEKVFGDNIDSGVSSVLNNRNSKATKSMKKSFNVRSQF